MTPSLFSLSRYQWRDLNPQSQERELSILPLCYRVTSNTIVTLYFNKQGDNFSRTFLIWPKFVRKKIVFLLKSDFFSWIFRKKMKYWSRERR